MSRVVLCARSYGMSKFISGVVGAKFSPSLLLAGGLMLTAAVNIAFGFGTSLAWFCVCWALNGTLQVRLMCAPFCDVLQFGLMIQCLACACNYIVAAFLPSLRLCLPTYSAAPCCIAPVAAPVAVQLTILAHACCAPLVCAGCGRPLLRAHPHNLVRIQGTLHGVARIQAEHRRMPTLMTILRSSLALHLPARSFLKCSAIFAVAHVFTAA